jgi:Ca-activated chloride channel family protein
LEEQAPDVPSTSKATGANAEGDPSAPDTSGDDAENHLAARGSSNPSDPARDEGGASAEKQQPLTERDQEIEQRLNRIPDDPGGLLREKLRRRYAQKRYSMNERR